MLVEPAFQGGAAFRRIELAAAGLERPNHLDQRPRLGQQLLEAGAPARAHQAVGIFAGGQRHEAQRLARLQQRQRALGRAEGGALAGIVAVEAQHRLVDHAPQREHLFFGQRGAQGRDGVGEAGLGQRDDVGIALDDDDGAGVAGCRAGVGPIIEDPALME